MRHPAFNNFGLKIISLGLAVLIYLVVKMSLDRQNQLPPALFRGPATQEYRCPVLVLHPAMNTQPVKVQPAEVSVRLSGDAVVLRRLRPSDIAVYVRLPDAAPIPAAVPLEVNPPRDVRLVDVQPTQVSVVTGNPQ